MSSNFDALIIGGGIMGLSTAFQLAGRGVSVAVLEKQAIGAGSSGKSSAIIRQHYSNEVTARMALWSLRVFRNFKGEVGGESGFTEAGFLVLVPEKDVDGLRANLALQRRVGIQTELLSQDELRHRWPYLETHDLVAAAYEPEAGYADPNLTLNAYAKAANTRGAALFQETEVTGIRFSGGRVTGVDTTNGPFSAPIVVNCAGPWGAHIARMAGCEAPINSCRVQVAFFRRPAGHEAPHPVVADFTHAVYWRPETGRLTLVGLIDPAEADAIVAPDHFNERVDFDFILDAGERLSRRFRAMEDSESTGGYAALYAITPDWHPVMDELVPGSGFFICAGFSGHGFKLGPAVGLMAADMVMGQPTPGLDRRLFRLNRYAENDPVRGRYEYSIAG